LTLNSQNETESKNERQSINSYRWNLYQI
jgi:hypothetical protein